MHKNYMKTEKPSKTYIDGSKPAAAKLALTFTLSALDATATLSPLLLHCYTNNNSINSVPKLTIQIAISSIIPPSPTPELPEIQFQS